MLTQYFAVRTRKLVSMVYWLKCVCVCVCVCTHARVCVCVCVCSVPQLCLTLWDPMNYNLPCSSVHVIFQARILEWVAISSSREFSQPRNGTHVSCVPWIAGRFFTIWATGKDSLRLRNFQERLKLKGMLERPFVNLGSSQKAFSQGFWRLKYILSMIATCLPWGSHIYSH